MHTAKILNILNGENATAEFISSGLPGEIIVWREVYTEGPLPVDCELGEFRAIRASYLSGIVNEWNEQQIYNGLAKMDAAVLSLRSGDVLRIWADACMFDQAIVARVLYLASQILAAGRPEIELYSDDVICSSPGAFSRLMATKMPLSEKDVADGAKMWSAFCDFRLPKVISPQFRFMPEALSRHICEAPTHRGSGHGLTAKRILQIASAPEGVSPLELFNKLSAMEKYPWFGDDGLWRIVDSLAVGNELDVIDIRTHRSETLANASPDKIISCRIFLAKAQERVDNERVTN